MHKNPSASPFSEDVAEEPEVPPRREWLLSDYDAETWEFGEHLPGTPAASSRLRWKYALPSGKYLSDTENRLWLEAVKCATWWYRETDENRSSRASSAVALGRELRMIAAWAIDQGISSPSQLERDDIETFIEYVTSLKVVISTARSKFLALRQLWLLRKHLPFALQSDPFPIQGDIESAARLAGTPDGHTLSLEPRQVFWAFNEALKWLDRVPDIRSTRNLILETHRDCLNNSSTINCHQRGERISASVNNAMSQWSWRSDCSINRGSFPSERFRIELGRCYGALLVLLFGFVAFRKHEAAYLTEDCIDLAGPIANLLGRVRKPSKTPTGMPTERAVHDVVVRVVAALRELAVDIRESERKELLITDPVRSMVYDNGPQPVWTRYLYSVIDEFSTSIDLNLTRPLRPHMLRRAFCQLHIWRYELGDLDTLSRYLFHTASGNTLPYIGPEESDDYLPEAEQTLAFDVISRNLDGKTELAGGFSAWLQRYRDRLRATIQVLSVERIAVAVRHLMAKQQLHIVAGPHGYCVRSTVRDGFAQCSTDGEKPDYANRTDIHCASCSNFLTHSAFLGHWVQMSNVHRAVLASKSSPAPLAEAARRGLAASIRIIEQIRASSAEDS